MMKKITTLLLTLAITIRVSAQNQNIVNWFNQLAKDSGNVEYVVQNECEEYIYHHSFGKNEREQVRPIIRKIRTWFDLQVPSALKSYRYEIHYPDADTITYSMALSNRKSLFSIDKFRKELPNAAELLAYEYKFSTSDRAYNRMELRYYRETATEIYDSIKPGKAEDLHHALNAYLKTWSYCNPKLYKVLYEYSDTFNYTNSKIPMQMLCPKPFAGTTKGTHYFLPLKEEKIIEAYEMLSSLFKSILMNRKDLEFYLRMNLNPQKEIHELMDNKGYSSIPLLSISNTIPNNIVEDPRGPKLPYMIQVNCEKNGLHILEVYSTTQFINFPVFWINIKMMKDNEYKYEKDFKMDYKF